MNIINKYNPKIPYSRLNIGDIVTVVSKRTEQTVSCVPGDKVKIDSIRKCHGQGDIIGCIEAMATHPNGKCPHHNLVIIGENIRSHVSVAICLYHVTFKGMQVGE